MTIPEGEVPVFVRPITEGQLLQTVAYLPMKIESKAFGELARLLHAMNKDLDVPGFGVDEEAQLVFFRCVLPCPDHKLDIVLLDAFLKTTELACKSFVHAIAAVASGKKTFDEIRALAREQATKKA